MSKTTPPDNDSSMPRVPLPENYNEIMRRTDEMLLLAEVLHETSVIKGKAIKLKDDLDNLIQRLGSVEKKLKNAEAPGDE